MQCMYSNFMNSAEVQGLLAAAQLIDMIQGPERAKEVYEKALPSSDALRNIGVIYFLDEKNYQNATQNFETAYLAGDMRALPWLIEAIEKGGVSNFDITSLKRKLDELLDQGNEQALIASYQINQINLHLEQEISLLTKLIDIKAEYGPLYLAQILNDNDKFDLAKEYLFEKKLIDFSIIDNFERRIELRDSLCTMAEKQGSVEAILYKAAFLVDSVDYASARVLYEKAARSEEFFAIIQYLRFESMVALTVTDLYQSSNSETLNKQLLIECAQKLISANLYEYVYWNLFINNAFDFMPLPESEKLRLMEEALNDENQDGEYEGFVGDYDDSWVEAIEEFERFRNGEGSIENLDKLLKEISEIDESEEVFIDTEDLFAQFINDSGYFRNDETGPRAMTDPEIFRVVYKYCEFNENIEVVLATSPFCPQDVIDKLAESEFEWEEDGTKQALARNQRDENLLRKLASEGPSTRYCVAGNPHTPIDVLEKLSKDSEYSYSESYVWDSRYSNLGPESVLIRYAVIYNPNCTLEILNSMKMDISSSKEKELQNLSKLIDKKIDFLINKMDMPSFFGDFEGRPNTAKPSKEPYPSPETLKLFESFEKTVELIHEGKYPDWPEFFATARKLKVDYFADHGESGSLADELLSVYEIDVEELYTNESFLNEIIKILPDETHFLCFLLNSNYSEKISQNILVKMWEEVSELEDPLYCEDCGMNRWWGNPVAYLAIQKNLSTDALDEINDLVEQISEAYIDDPRVYEDELDLISLALASNENTPIEVLKALSKKDKNSIKANDQDSPFYVGENQETSNISETAKRTLSKLNQ